jgi:hypothetical protein
MSDDVTKLVQPTTFMGLSDHVEELIEAAYWEMLARQDPTQTQYPNSGERYAFKMAVRQIFHSLRGEPLRGEQHE